MASSKNALQYERKWYKGIMMFACEFDEIQVMDTREDDIWVCSYPRSGTTLTQELVYTIQTGDYEKANSVQLDERVPMVDVKDDRFPYHEGVKYVEQLASPRMIKCHLHHFMLPEQLRNEKKGRIIYICRNPKDVVTSFYRLMEWGGQLEDGNIFNTFVDTFVGGTGYLCPWPKHLLGYWERRNDDNVLFLKYEDVIKDLPKAVRTIADFLKKDLTDEEVKRVCEHCKFDSMKNNDMCNWSYKRDLWHIDENASGGFMNKGKAGTWKDFLSPETSSKIDVLLRELQDSGLDLPNAVKRIAKFLNKELTDERIEKICDYCKFDNMKNNDTCNMSYLRDFKHVNDKSGGGFMNKGKAGAWKELLSPETAGRIDGLIREIDASGLVIEDN